jgi:hypothetical protein
MKTIVKKGLNFIGLLLRVLADCFLWLAKQAETLAKDCVYVTAGQVYLVKRLENNTQWSARIERSDFSRNAALEPMFPIDLTSVSVDIDIDGQVTKLYIRRGGGDKALIALAKSFSETILIDNEQLLELLTPKLTEMVRHIPVDDWVKQTFEGCIVVNYQVSQRAA